MKMAHQRDCKPLMDYHVLVGEWFFLRIHIPQSRVLHQLFSLTFYLWFNNPGYGKCDSPETRPTMDSAHWSGNCYCYFHFLSSDVFSHMQLMSSFFSLCYLLICLFILITSRPKRAHRADTRLNHVSFFCRK